MHHPHPIPPTQILSIYLSVPRHLGCANRQSKSIGVAAETKRFPKNSKRTDAVINTPPAGGRARASTGEPMGVLAVRRSAAPVGSVVTFPRINWKLELNLEGDGINTQ
jgi:hypothetical protein